MDNKKLIGTRLNSALAKKGIKQKELAQQIGVTDNTISYFCSGSRTPNIETLISIARALNVSSDYLLGLSEVITPSADLQAVVAYTGLSEDNVGTLNTFKLCSDLATPTIYDSKRNTRGEEPFLDCANDILDAMYENKEALISIYYLLRSTSRNAAAFDFDYLDEGRDEEDLRHGCITMSADTALQLCCTKIGDMIKAHLTRKYVDSARQNATDQEQEG